MKFEHEFEDILSDITDKYFDPDLFVAAEGNLDADLMLVGEAPGATEAKEGRPFVGRGGDILNDALDSAGTDRSETYVTNLVKVRPPDNRDPYRDEINAWKPLIEKEIEVVNPDGIITLGRIAMYELAETDLKITEVRGERFGTSDYQIYPTYHPAATLYNRDRLGPFQQDIKRAVNEVF
jgi:DNA polymerase